MLLQHGGSFRSFISRAGNDARRMVELIVEKIPSYRDEAVYEVRAPRGGVTQNNQVVVKKFWAGLQMTLEVEKQGEQVVMKN